MKLFFQNKGPIVYLAVLSMMAASCEKQYFPKPPTPPPPRTPVQTTALEASYVTAAPLTLTDAYWKSADFLRVTVGDLNKNALYGGDGYLNMSGTYNGVSSFNNGADPKLTMKAAYDDNKLYLYAEWTDNTISPAFAMSTVDGFPDPLKTDTTGGWSAQGNSDKMSLAFDISNATGSAGTFADKGCAASCHAGKMQPEAGAIDLWTWDLATSDALGYAADRVSDATTGLADDAGTGMYTSNFKIPGNPRSGPAYEWDGNEQSVTRPDGKTVNLDPGYFLLNKTPFTGDYAKGKTIYHTDATAGCYHCHGVNGKDGEATPFASIGFARKYSRQTLVSFASSDNHDGNTYWARVQPGNVADLLAYIKGVGGLAGVYLNTPTGSHADVWTVSNVARAKINASAAHTTYQVLLVRKLSTLNTDDIQFTLPEGKSYPFGVALMNGDSKNHVGSLKQTLTFKTKTQ